MHTQQLEAAAEHAGGKMFARLLRGNMEGTQARARSSTRRHDFSRFAVRGSRDCVGPAKNPRSRLLSAPDVEGKERRRGSRETCAAGSVGSKRLKRICSTTRVAPEQPETPREQ